MKTSSFKPFLIAAVVAGTFSIAGNNSDAGNGNADKKVVICHKGNTLEVSINALDAHLGHGDTIGACNISPGQNR